MDVTLRCAQLKDADAMFQWMNDEETVKYLGYGFLKRRTLEDITEELRLRIDGEFSGYCFSIVDEDDTRYYGQINLLLPDERAKTAEISLALMPDARGRGIARDALLSVMKWGFCGCGYQKLYAKCLSENRRATALFEKCGFRREGVLRRHMLVSGALLDVFFYGMLKEEYLGLYD